MRGPQLALTQLTLAQPLSAGLREDMRSVRESFTSVTSREHTRRPAKDPSTKGLPSG